MSIWKIRVEFGPNSATTAYVIARTTSQAITALHDAFPTRPYDIVQLERIAQSPWDTIIVTAG